MWGSGGSCETPFCHLGGGPESQVQDPDPSYQGTASDRTRHPPFGTQPHTQGLCKISRGFTNSRERTEATGR